MTDNAKEPRQLQYFECARCGYFHSLQWTGRECRTDGYRLTYDQLQRVAEWSEVDAPEPKPKTMNDLPEHERRGYDRYQQELAVLEYTLAEERKAVYGDVASDRIGSRLGEVELRKTWPEWLDGIDGPEAEDEQQRLAWEAEVDAVYAQEQVERLAAEQEELRNDH